MIKQNTGSPWLLLLNYLILAVLVLVSVFLTVSTVLFPGALFDFAGGWQGLKLIFMVDISLAVLFLLAVFRPKKPLLLLRKDLLIVAALQLSILAGGVFMLYWARPLAVVYVFNEFHVLNRENYAEAELDFSALSSFSGGTPKILWQLTEDNEPAFIGGEVLAGLNGKPSATLRLDTYQVMLTEGAGLEKVLRLKQVESEDCWRVNISSNYDSGSVCYDWRDQSFSGFSEQRVKPAIVIEAKPDTEAPTAKPSSATKSLKV